MVEYAIFMVKNSFRGLGSFLPQIQGFYREFGLHLSQSEALVVSGAGIGLAIAALVWMFSK